MKASDAIKFVSELVAKFGAPAVVSELDVLEGTVAPSEVARSTRECVEAFAGDIGEVRALVASLQPVASEPAAPRHRRTEAEVANTEALVLTAVRDLGTEVSAAELAVRLQHDVNSVSYALRQLAEKGTIKRTGDKRAARYSAQ